MARKPIIAGNWKMNNTIAETKELITGLIPLVKDAKCDVVICTPYTDLATAVEMTKGTNIKVGAENVHWAEKGAFTGEISAKMLVELGVEYVIIGHSERRQYFGETDTTVNQRTIAALNAGLKPIVCVGETLDQRQKNRTKSVIKKQVVGAFANIDEEAAKNIVIAYEPVWAIGTGVTATDEQAQETIKNIRTMVARIYNRKFANKMRIQYGGSMNPKNVAGLMAQPDIDGGLIGGASLKAEDFSKVVLY